MAERAPDRTKRRAGGGRLRRWLTRGSWLLGVAGILVVAGYLQRTFLFTEMAKAWVVEDPVAKADAIVVLGGGPATRPFAAARLYRAGVAPVILYMNVRLTPEEKLGICRAENEVTREILSRSGVPASAMQAIGSSVGSTYDESRAVRTWESRSGAKSLVIVTDVFHTRRARWVFEQELRGTGVAVHLEGVPTLDYGTTNWWKNEQGVISFENEVVKYIYYRMVH